MLFGDKVRLIGGSDVFEFDDTSVADGLCYVKFRDMRLRIPFAALEKVPSKGFGTLVELERQLRRSPTFTMAKILAMEHDINSLRNRLSGHSPNRPVGYCAHEMKPEPGCAACDEWIDKKG